MSDKSESKNEAPKPAYSSAWADVANDINQERIIGAMNAQLIRPGEAAVGAKAQTAVTNRVGDPTVMRALDREIRYHKAHDDSHSYLGKVVDLVWRKDQKSLKELQGLYKDYVSASQRGDSKASSKIELAIKDKIRKDMSAVGLKDEMETYGPNFVKTMFLFLRGNAGMAGTIASYTLDSMKPSNPIKLQAIDGMLGAAQGGLMREALGTIGQSDLPIAAKGVSLGIAQRALAVGLNRGTYFDPTTGNYSAERGLSNTFLATVHPQALMTDAAVFATAAGAVKGLDTISGGAISKSPYLGTLSTAYVMGSTNGALREVSREQAKGEFHPGTILLRSSLQGGLDALAASPGGLQTAMHMDKVRNNVFAEPLNESVEPVPADAETVFQTRASESPKFSFAKSAKYEVTARQVTDPNGESVPTKENQKGELAGPGSWVIQRNPTDIYPVSAEYFAQRWEPVPGKEGIYTPKAIPVEMVELKEPLHIKRPWGDMHGSPGDFLAHYGPDDYAIVARSVLPETYQGVDAHSQAKVQDLRNQPR